MKKPKGSERPARGFTHQRRRPWMRWEHRAFREGYTHTLQLPPP